MRSLIASFSFFSRARSNLFLGGQVELTIHDLKFGFQIWCCFRSASKSSTEPISSLRVAFSLHAAPLPVTAGEESLV